MLSFVCLELYVCASSSPYPVLFYTDSHTSRIKLNGFSEALNYERCWSDALNSKTEPPSLLETIGISSQFENVSRWLQILHRLEVSSLEIATEGIVSDVAIPLKQPSFELSVLMFVRDEDLFERQLFFKDSAGTYDWFGLLDHRVDVDVIHVKIRPLWWISVIWKALIHTINEQL